MPDETAPTAAESPQGMAMTLLADYGLRARAWIPSGAVVELLGEFGVTPGNARAAISRLSRQGVLERFREGRWTAYRVSPGAAEGLVVGGQAVVGLSAAAESWDGWWTVVVFSLSTAGDARRRALRHRLRWLGFAPLYDGFWVSPQPVPDAPLLFPEEFPAGAVTVFRAQQVALDGVRDRDPLTAWDLADVEGRYAAFVSRWAPMLPRIRAGEVGGAEALRARTALMDSYRHFLVLDPRIPERFMPPGWPRRAAREVFVAVYDGLLGPALAHVTGTVVRHARGPVPALKGHTVADLLAGIATSVADG